MEKLFWIISLSLIIGCGKRPPLEEYISPSIAQRELVNGAPWPTVSIENVTVEGLMGDKTKLRNRREEEFYQSFKEQYKNDFYNLEPGSMHEEMIVSIDDPRNVAIYPVFSNLNNVKKVKISIASLRATERKVFIDLNTNLSPLVINADLSEVASGPFEALIKVENYNYELKGKTYQYASSKRSHLSSQYMLIIDNGWETETFYVPAGDSLEEAFLRYGIEYEINRKYELSSLNEEGNENWNQDLNVLPDKTYFWRIINTPNQKVNFRPLAGQKIMIKRIELKKLKEVAAIRRTRSLKLTTPVLPSVVDPLVASRKIKSVTAYLLIPKQLEKYEIIFCEPISFGSGGGMMKNNRGGNFVTYTIGYQKLKIETPSYMFSGVGKKSYKLDMMRPPIELKTGKEYWKKGSKCAKKHKSTVIKKSYSHKYDLNVVVEETMKL